MTFTLAVGLVMAMVVARSVLPPALRVLSRHASPELYQLTLIAFCLLCGWLSGFMVRRSAPPPAYPPQPVVKLHQIPLVAFCLVSAGCAKWEPSLCDQVKNADSLPCCALIAS